MAPGDDKIDKLNTTNETQENSPDVSVDNKNENNKKQKEQEEDMTTKNTQTNLVELQKKIEIIKTSKQYTQEIKDQATQIESDLTGAQIDQTTITTKAKEIAELEKQKTPQTFPEKVWNWFKKTSFGTAVTSLLKKWGLGDIFGDTESPIIAPKKNAPSAAPRATQNTAVETTETSENSDEESPQVDGEAIDDAIIPNAEPEVKEEKKPEMSKVDIEREVKVSMDNFWEVVKSIDSGFSMFTKNDKDIKDDGIKLDAAYQKVLDQLKNISEFFPNDESMKELMRKTMSELSSFYRDKAETDNDHHVDPIKAVQLLIPTVSEIEDVMGQKADLLPMPTQEKLIEELKKTSEGMKIADKIAVLVVK
ncbi:hypothetical protein KBC03_01595 [Patescibacteria group bacterium]|nr:hypothetical protein [Patescibacteria group bacterium]